MEMVFSFINADLHVLELPMMFIAAPHPVGELGLRPAQAASVVQSLHLYSELLNAQLIA